MTMAKLGRPPKANVLTVFGEKLEPLPEIPPARLAKDPAAVELYEEIRGATLQTGHLLRMHLPLVSMFISAVLRAERADSDIIVEGSKIRGEKGYVQNPDVRTWRASVSAMTELAKELALTPSQLQRLRTDLRERQNNAREAKDDRARLVDFLPGGARAAK
jgi:phage terminase small subunit